MPKSKKLHQQIENKLEALHELLDNIDEVKAIDPNDPDTWDPDALYNLVEKCKEVLKLLEDQPIKGQYDEFDQPLTEDGLCSLVDNYQEEEND